MTADKVVKTENGAIMKYTLQPFRKSGKFKILYSLEDLNGFEKMLGNINLTRSTAYCLEHFVGVYEKIYRIAIDKKTKSICISATFDRDCINFDSFTYEYDHYKPLITFNTIRDGMKERFYLEGCWSDIDRYANKWELSFCFEIV